MREGGGARYFFAIFGCILFRQVSFVRFVKTLPGKIVSKTNLNSKMSSFIIYLIRFFLLCEASSFHLELSENLSLFDEFDHESG